MLRDILGGLPSPGVAARARHAVRLLESDPSRLSSAEHAKRMKGSLLQRAKWKIETGFVLLLVAGILPTIGFCALGWKLAPT